MRAWRVAGAEEEMLLAYIMCVCECVSVSVSVPVTVFARVPVCVCQRWSCRHR